MNKQKQKWTSNWIAYAAAGLLLSGSYVGGYFWLGERNTVLEVRLRAFGGEPHHIRKFKNNGLRKVFAPLGWAEAKIRGKYVHLHSTGASDQFEPDW